MHGTVCVQLYEAKRQCETTGHYHLSEISFISNLGKVVSQITKYGKAEI